MLTTLVDTETLASHLKDPIWAILDCSFDLTEPSAGARAYLEGHIPGAHYAHLDEDLASPITPTSGRHPLPDPTVLAHKLGQWGVDASKQVVAYDDSCGSIAGRLWWLLRWLGHDGVAVLDGGLSKWRREGRPLTAYTSTVSPIVFEFSTDDGRWLTTKDVEELLARGGHKLLDNRTHERFVGDVEPLDKVAGHIPGAINRPLQDNLGDNGCFLADDVLYDQFVDLLAGIPPESTVSMCGSGITACHTLLALERAGFCGAKLYAGSWSEWITNNTHPVAKGA